MKYFIAWAENRLLSLPIDIVTCHNYHNHNCDKYHVTQLCLYEIVVCSELGGLTILIWLLSTLHSLLLCVHLICELLFKHVTACVSKITLFERHTFQNVRTIMLNSGKCLFYLVVSNWMTTWGLKWQMISET